MRLADAEAGDATTPAFDPNSHHDSAGFSEDAAGWGFSLNNVTAGDGIGEGASWTFGAPTGFVLDGNWAIAYRITQVNRFVTGSKNLWTSLAVCDRAGDPTNASAICLSGGFAERVGGTFLLQQGRTSDTPISAASTNKVHGLWVPNSTDLGTMIARGVRSGDIPTMANARNDSNDIVGDLKVLICAGADSALADGPHAGKYKFEYAAVPWVPAGTF